MSNTQGSDRKSLRPGAILNNPNNIRCRVDRVEHGTVYLSVLDNKSTGGMQEHALPIDEVTATWTLKKAAA